MDHLAIVHFEINLLFGHLQPHFLRADSLRKILFTNCIDLLHQRDDLVRKWTGPDFLSLWMSSCPTTVWLRGLVGFSEA